MSEDLNRLIENVQHCGNSSKKVIDDYVGAMSISIQRIRWTRSMHSNNRRPVSLESEFAKQLN